jgi:hypothetical protein
MHLPLNLQKSFHPERRPRLAILVDLEVLQLLFLPTGKKRLFRSMAKMKRRRRKKNTQERRRPKFQSSKFPFRHY